MHRFLNYDYVAVHLLVAHARVGTRSRIYKYSAKNNNPLFLCRSSNHIHHSISSVRFYLATRKKKEERRKNRKNCFTNK